jgi:hypothetical protein
LAIPNAMAVAICSRDALVKVGIVSRRDSDAGNLGGRLERDDDDAKQEFHRRQNSFRIFSFTEPTHNSLQHLLVC